MLENHRELINETDHFLNKKENYSFRALPRHIATSLAIKKKGTKAELKKILDNTYASRYRTTSYNTVSELAAYFSDLDSATIKQVLVPFLLKNNRDQQYWKTFFKYHSYIRDKAWKKLTLPTYDELMKFKNVDTEKMYRISRIRQKNKKVRVLEIPNDELAEIQTKVANLLTLYYPEPEFVKAYIKNRSAKDLVKELVNKEFVLTMDIKNAYQNTSIHNIISPINLGDDNITKAVKNIIGYKGRLPTGAPSSPVAFNISLLKIDYYVKRMAVYMGCDYYRYSDNVFFCNSSGVLREAIPKNSLIRQVKIQFARNKYTMHKVKKARDGRRKKYLGITTNSGFMSTQVEYRKLLRAEIMTKGLTLETKGKLAYIKYVNNKQYKPFERYIAKLKRKGILNKKGKKIK